MTAKEIVAKWIETEWLSHDPAIKDAEEAIVAGLKADIEAAVEEEREACAKMAEDERTYAYAANLAKRIRARSERREVR
jgi:hypothetical protein